MDVNYLCGENTFLRMNQLIYSFLFCLLFLTTACEPDRTGAGTAMEEVPVSGDPGIVRLTEAINQNPENADLYAQRATMHYDKKNYEAAIADLGVAISIDSTNIPYHYNLSDVYMEYYRSRLALRTLERAAALNPDLVETQLRLAETQLQLKQYDDAIGSLNEATRIDPRNPDAYLLLSQVFQETGDTARAIKAAEEATQIDPDMIDAYIALGQLLFAKGLPRAEQYFDAAVAIDPEDVYALHAKADYLRDVGDLQAAIDTYRKASMADRQYVAGHFNAGLLLMELDSVERAYQEFDLVIKNDPVHIRGFFFRGYASEVLGDTAKARRDYQTALAFAPDYELAQQGMARIGGQ
jgi:tetratricopeptide (TPR) repeat protein